MGVAFLEPSDPAWRQAIERVEGADVYAEPGYVAAAARGERALLAVVAVRGTELVVPLVEQAVPAELEAPGTKDAESPYGFGGVWSRRESGTLEECWSALARALAERGVVNVFLRLHPFADRGEADALLFGMPRPIAFVPLDGGWTGAFPGSACATHRSQVRRARALGFEAESIAGPSRDALVAFREAHHATLDRVRAAPSYYLDDVYFWALAAALGDRLLLVRVRAPAGMSSQALFMAGGRFAHYHLAARADSSHNAAAHLTLDAGAQWALGRRLALLNLGGGMSGREDDSLLAFKRRVGRGRGEARVAGLIADPDRHRVLVSAWEARAGRAATWFQGYRQPLPAG